MPDSPPRRESKTPKLQSLLEMVAGGSGQLSAEHNWDDTQDVDTPAIYQPDIATDRPAQSQRSNCPTRPVTRIDRQRLGLATPSPRPQPLQPDTQYIIRPSSQVASILDLGRRHGLVQRRPAHLDAGVEAILYGPIYGMGAPPARAQVVPNQIQSRNSYGLYQREQDVNRGLVQWREDYLRRARATSVPPWVVSSAPSKSHTGKEMQDTMSWIERHCSVEPESSKKIADSVIDQTGAVGNISHSWRNGKHLTTPTRRKLQDTRAQLAPSQKRIRYEICGLDALEMVPEITSDRVIEPDWIPNLCQSDKKTEIDEPSTAANTITTSAVCEVVECGGTTTILHLTTQSPPQALTDSTQSKPDPRILRAAEVAHEARNNLMAVKHSQMVLDNLCQQHSNWKKNAEAMNESIIQNVAKLRQLEPAATTRGMATRSMVKRSSFLTALAGVNLQILDELQKGIPEINLDYPSEDSGESSKSGESVESGVSGNSGDSDGSGQTEEFHFEPIENDDGEYWVDLCAPVSIGGKS